MKMEGIEHLLPQDANPGRHEEGLRQLIKKEIEEYARGLDPAIRVDVEEHSAIHKHYTAAEGLRFVFHYRDEQAAYTTDALNDRDVTLAEDVLDKFYKKVRGK